jgi:TRAP-type C4-dicarboxylate transport system permease small subunit
MYEAGKLAIAGFEFDYKQGKSGNINLNVCASYTKPVEGSITFPSTVINEKTGEEVRFEIRQMIALISKSPENITIYVKIMNITANIMGLIIFAFFVYIPFVGYRIMKSITQNRFYSMENIKRIKKISLILLLIFVINLFINLTATISTDSYLQIKDYKPYMGDFNYSALFIGLILLILSEILQYTKNMKEEQDLTI